MRKNTCLSLETELWGGYWTGRWRWLSPERIAYVGPPTVSVVDDKPRVGSQAPIDWTATKLGKGEGGGRHRNLSAAPLRRRRQVDLRKRTRLTLFTSFLCSAIGVPSLQKVTVRNPTASKVRFDAISGSTVHFHCSFPEHKVGGVLLQLIHD